MIVSNKFLSFLLIFTLFFSVVSVLVNLNKLDSLEATGGVVTDFGYVTLEVHRSISITTVDSSYINFGTCKLLGRDINITSERTKDTAEACPGFLPKSIAVRNNGNVHVSVVVKANKVGAFRGGSFLVSPSNMSDIAYKVKNLGVLGNLGGCASGIGPSNYASFFVANTDYDVCEHLSVGSVGSSNSVLIDFELLVPGDIGVGSSDVVITFTAFEYVFD